MSTALNADGMSHARSLVAAGKINRGAWSFSADDGNKLLGANGDDWVAYSKWFLATHPDQPTKTKAHYGYPFGKGGEVYKNAVVAAKGRAAQQGATSIVNACTELLDKIDPPKGIRDFQGMRLYAPMEIKSMTAKDPDAEIEIEGIASTPSTDRMGDIVIPTGAKFKLPLPLVYQHNTKEPIGLVTWAKPNKNGIPFKATIARAGVTSFIDEARALIRAGLIRATSIGFMPIESEPIDEKDPFFGGTRFLEWEWLELSPVTIPAQAEATIDVIKSFDREFAPAASGDSRASSGRRLTSPGASGSKPSSKGTKVKTIKEQIEGLEAKRVALAAESTDLMNKAAEEDRTLDDDEADRDDELQEEIKKIDRHLARLRQHEQRAVSTAVVVSSDAGEDPDIATRVRTAGGGNGSSYVSWGKSRLPEGVRFTRYALCLAKAKGNLMQAEVLSRQFMDSSPEVNLALKTAVAAGTTQDSTWAAPLVQLQEMQSEFVEFLRPQTIIGRVPGIRRVPFNIKFTRQNTGTSGHFVGEGLPKPLGKMDFELLSLTWAKAATLIVMTEELVRFSNPAAETLARDDLAAGIAQYLDKRFIDPVYAGVANVSPASITNGITPVASLGTSIANITDTCGIALGQLTAADLNSGNFVWIMNPTIALDLSLKRTTQDIFAFPSITAQGGTFLGYPVITSNNVVLSGSPTESFVVLVDPTNIMLADDGGVSIDMSTEASVEMSDAPSGGATSLVSLWQNNLIGLRAERFINWRRRRETAVAVITMNVKW